MNPVIIEYKNIESLLENHYFNCGLMITALGDMQDAFYKRGIKRVTSINGLLKSMLKSWFKEETKLLQYFKVCSILDSLKIPVSEANIYSSFQSNKKDILASMRMLLEIGVPTDALPDNTSEQKYFKQVYAEFCSLKDCGVDEFIEKVSLWCDKDKLKQEFLNALYNGNSNSISDKEASVFMPKCIALQGFQYANAIQARLIKALCSLNVPVYFLNNVDEGCLEYYEVWKHNPLFECVTEYRNIEFEKVLQPRVNNIEVRKFRDNFAMVRFIEKNSKLKYYAPGSDEVKEIIDTFFPDKDNKSHILAYPAGRYLMDMYDMWSDADQCIEILPDRLRSCLATGWAEKNWHDGSKLLAIYDKVSDYFSDCKSVDDWMNRSKMLLEVKKNIFSLFPISDKGPKLSRWHNFMANPLALVGAFDCTEEDIHYLCEAIKNVLDDAKTVFVRVGSPDLKEHFRKIRKLLDQKASKAEISQEEQAVLKKIQTRLSYSPENFKVISNTHLVEAMRFFLGGSIGDITSEDEVSAENRTVLSLPSIESHILLHPDQKALICCCDENNMPGHARKYPWPLSKDYLSSLKLQRDVESNCCNQVWYMDSVRLSNRYFMHVAKCLPDVELTWIEKNKNKYLNPSVYLRQVKEIEYFLVTSGVLLEDNGKGAQTEIINNDLNRILRPAICGLPEEAKFDMQVCPSEPQIGWRYLYDFVLGEHPYYVTKFQMDFYLSTLITLIAQNSNDDTLKNSADEVFKVYPARSESEREEMLSFALRKRAIQNKFGDFSFDGVYYSGGRLYLEYLDKKWIESRKFGTDYDDSYNCHFCPHNDYCFIKGE